VVTEHQHVPCITVLSKADDSPGFSTLRCWYVLLDPEGFS